MIATEERKTEMIYGEFIMPKEARRLLGDGALGMSAAQMARAVGMRRSVFEAWLAGREELSEVWLARITQVYRMEMGRIERDVDAVLESLMGR